MRRLVFIDDDETELDNFHKIVGGIYDYNTVYWPNESSSPLRLIVKLPGRLPSCGRSRVLIRSFS
jgi:hypothetical protein